MNDGGDLGGTAFVRLTPNNAERIIYVRNSLTASRAINIFQGTYNASNDYTLAAGEDAALRANAGPDRFFLHRPQAGMLIVEPEDRPNALGVHGVDDKPAHLRVGVLVIPKRHLQDRRDDSASSRTAGRDVR